MRLTVALLFLALLAVLAACTNGEPSTPSNRQAFVGGSEAIKLSFVPNAPPPETVDKPSSDSEVLQFNVIVIAENVGEYAMDPDNVEVKITGFLPADFGVSDATGEDSVMVRKLSSVEGHREDQLFASVRKDPDGNAIQGETVHFSFPTGNTPFGFDKPLKGNQVYPIRATACYEYKTVVQTDYCVLENFLTTEDNPLCNPKSTRTAENSGAPIHVSSVTQSVGGKNKVILNFKVDQVGSGTIFLGDKEGLGIDNSCDPSFRNKNRVRVYVDTGLENLEMTCPGLIGFGEGIENEGTLLLDAGSAEFTCIVETPLGVEAVNSLELELSYYVQDSIETSIVVKHLLE